MGDAVEKEPPLAVVAAASCDGSNGGVRENANVQILFGSFEYKFFLLAKFLTLVVFYL